MPSASARSTRRSSPSAAASPPRPGRTGSRACARSRSRARRGGPQQALAVAQLARDRAGDPVAAHRGDDLAAGRTPRGPARGRAASTSSPSTRNGRPCARSAASTPGSSRSARPPPACGLTIRQTGPSMRPGRLDATDAAAELHRGRSGARMSRPPRPWRVQGTGRRSRGERRTTRSAIRWNNAVPAATGRQVTSSPMYAPGPHRSSRPCAVAAYGLRRARRWTRRTPFVTSGSAERDRRRGSRRA